jgi:hypothetical protein
MELHGFDATAGRALLVAGGVAILAGFLVDALDVFRRGQVDIGLGVDRRLGQWGRFDGREGRRFGDVRA